MNRCFKARFSAVCVTLLLAMPLAVAPVGASAQTDYIPTAPARIRPFPTTALRAALVVTQTPNVLIDGKPARLSPGVRIHGANNMLVMSATLTGQQLLVNFVREPQGLVHEVWILTEAEARMPQPLATPHPYSR